MPCTQTKSIEIQVFLTPKGDSTCSTSPKENCAFLQSTRFGLEYTCCTLPVGEYLNRYEDEGNEYLKPHEGCIVWKGEE